MHIVLAFFLCIWTNKNIFVTSNFEIRRNMRTKICVFLALLSLPTFAADYDVTFPSLLRDMTDPAAHTRWEKPSYRCSQSSSYSRESVTPATAAEDGKFRPESGRDWGKGWFENHDFSNFVRTEEVDGQTEYVMHYQEGPGCLVRMWTAVGGPSDEIGGLIKIYLDGSETPVIAMDSKRLLGSNGLVGYPFAFYAPAKSDNDTWRGNNLFLPIPYNSGCKVSYRPYMVDGRATAEFFYYQINYRSYEAGTRVESYNGETLKKYAKELYACSTMLTGAQDVQKDEQAKARPGTLRPGKAKSFRVKGEKCITSLNVQIKAEDTSKALMGTMLRVKFDGEQTVDCPVGMFYGIGPFQLPNHTFYVQTWPDGMMTTYWVMPFEKETTVTLVNESDEDVDVECLQATVRESDWDDDKSMHFYASWCSSKGIDSNTKFDYNYVSIKGKGRYVADGLSVYNYSPAERGDTWWGEGDEKIFVDGESFPSHFGTGTEDYYSYAYCRPQPFSHPFISQPIGDGNKTPGQSMDNRYRLLDDIPFEKSFDFYMEIWHAYYDPMDYAPVTFWYAFPGCKWSHTNP